MMRYILAVLLLAGLAADASACGRCGLFGRKCRYSCGHYVAPVAYAPPSTSTNFIFNNVYPSAFPYLLAQGGNSVYGVQQASAAYAESPAFYMDRAARFTDRAFDLAQTGQAAFNSNSTLALQVSNDIDRRRNNAYVAALAMEANGPTQQQLTVQIQDGKMAIVQPPQAVTQGGPQQVQPQQLVQANSCATCHDGRGTNNAPKAVVLDGSVFIDKPLLEKCNLRIMDGTMPPKSQLSAQQKAIVMASLADLLQRAPVLDQRQPPAEALPPPPVPQPPMDGNLH